MLSKVAVPFIKATLPLLKENGVEITRVFYKEMFAAHPELKNIFNITNQAKGTQQQSLANALYAYATNIDDLSVIMPVMKRIAHKHASLGIQAQQYKIVGKYLLEAIATVLKDHLTPEIVAAWQDAYWQMAGQLIGLEAKLYYETEVMNVDNWFAVKVFDIKVESPEVKSIYLKPINNRPLPLFKPGQYISVAVDVEDLELQQIRQYSLSDAPNTDYWRITVKREKASTADTKEGIVSNKVHQLNIGDTINISSCYGDFHLDTAKENPVVLISAGVGITPMMSMLKSISQQNSNRVVKFLHAARTSQHQIFVDEVMAANKNLHYMKSFLFYDQQNDIDEQDGLGLSIVKGRMELDFLRHDILLEDADYFICGPIEFMHIQRRKLMELGVDPCNIYYEVFGPDLLAGLL